MSRSHSTEELIKRWQRVADAANLEKEWMHDRLTWLFTPQAVLFGILVLLIESKPAGESLRDRPYEGLIDTMVWLIPAAGFGMALLGFFGVAAAGIMHWTWTTEVNKLASKINKDGEMIVTFGSRPHEPARTSSFLPVLIALIFVLFWLIVLVAAFGW